MISSIFSFEITNVVPEPRIFYKLPADAGAAVNCGGIKTLQVNDVITFFFEYINLFLLMIQEVYQDICFQ